MPKLWTGEAALGGVSIELLVAEGDILETDLSEDSCVSN